MRNMQVRLSHCLLLLSLVLVAPLTPAQGPARAEQRRAPAARPAQAGRAPNQRAEAIQQNNLGVAYMGQQRFPDAERSFARAIALDPGLDLARLNRGIALLYLQRNSDAGAVLQAYARTHPPET